MKTEAATISTQILFLHMDDLGGSMWVCCNQRKESKADYADLTADFDGNKTKDSDFMLFCACLDSPISFG